MLSEQLKAKLDSLPAQPGVYIMKDKAGDVVYVGKALSLRSRVMQYFQERTGDTRAFIPFLEDLLGDLEVMITPSEKDAVLLENELIKKHRPRFNVRLRDDKNFISLRLSTTHPYPRLEVVRRVRKDGARYFGPFASASSIRETLSIVNRHFQLRTCTDQVMANRRRPCLQYQIKRCPAPCVYSVPQDDYRRSVDEVALFLEGKAGQLTTQIHGRMKDAAGKLEFERAAQLRDQLQAIERSQEKQRTVQGEQLDSDVRGPALDVAGETAEVLAEVARDEGQRQQDGGDGSGASGIAGAASDRVSLPPLAREEPMATRRRCPTCPPASTARLKRR